MADPRSSGRRTSDGRASGTAPEARASEKTPVFRVLATLVLPFMYSVARYRLHDAHKVPASGAFVLAPNHYSEIDPIVVGIAMWRIGRMPHYLTKSALFKYPVLGFFLRRTGQVPVERSGTTRASDPLIAAQKIVNDGSGVIIYPEGSLTRDPDLWPMRGKSGAVRMALAADIPLIPAAHWGTQKLLPRYAKRISVFPRKTIDIRFGDPVDLSEFRGRPLDSATVTAATAALMAAITGLLEELRGETAPPVRWDPAKNNQRETGRF